MIRTVSAAMARALIVLAPLLLLASLASTARAQSSTGTLTVSIVPQLPAARIHAEWKPILDRVTAATGQRFRLVFEETIPDFEKAFLEGKHDLVFMNPYHAVMAQRAQGYVPLLRDQTPLTGILVVRKDSGIRALADLAGQQIAYPAPNAFGASLYMRALLDAEPGLVTHPVYVETHGNVYRRVAIGDFVAGGGVNQTLADSAPELRAMLRTLYETPPAASHPLCAHPRVPEALRQRLQEAFIALRGDASGRLLLAAARVPVPVQADYTRDYLPLESLALDAQLPQAPP
jgi:phosphonate transport system substrate-binding protein